MADDMNIDLASAEAQETADSGADRPGGTSSPSQGLPGAAALMILATLASAVTGLIRAMAFQWHYGQSPELNAYFQAFRIPDFIYFLVAGGAMRTGFVPVFTRYRAQGNLEQAWRTFRATFWILLLVSTTVVGLGMIFARPLAVFIAPGWAAHEPRLFNLTAYLMQVMFPAQIFMLLGGLFMGALNAHKQFLWPALGPILYNVLIIIAAVVAPFLWGLPTIAFAVPVSALLCNVVLQVGPLQRQHAQWGFLLDFRDPGFRQVMKLAAPIIFGLSIAEVNLLVTAALVTLFDPQWGPVAMEYGNRLWKFPTRFIGAGIAIAVFPFLAEHYAKEDRSAYRRDFSFAIRSTLFLTIPPALVMTLLGDPINRLLFGNLNEEALRATGSALFWYSLGIVPLSLDYILTRAFYARHDTVTPVWIGMSSIVVCVACAFPLGRAMGVGGLALATSAANFSNLLLLATVLQRRVGLLDGRRIAAGLARQALPAVGFGLGCHYGLLACRHYLGYSGLTARLAAVLAPMVLATVLFLALAWLFRVEELTSARQMLARRWRRR